MGLKFYDRDNNEISKTRWTELLRAEIDGKPYNVVDHTQSENWIVMTNWEGYSASEPPLIFQTVVFVDGRTVISERHALIEGAARRHKQLAGALERGLTVNDSEAFC